MQTNSEGRTAALNSTHPTHCPPAFAMSAQQLTAAKELPPRLIRFFQRYPPPALFPNLTSAAAASPSAPATPQTTPPTISTAPPSDPNAPVTETSAPELPSIPSTAPRNSRIPAHAHDLPYPNPFLPSKNFTTGRWHGPAFGLRKQADLVKLAVQHDVVDLLPWTIKKPGEKDARRIESGLMVKGTGEGQKVKGKTWERTLKGRLEMRRQAMLNMPQMIQEWKQVSHGLTREHCLSLANQLVERTWPRMEEVAKWAGEEMNYPKLHLALPWTAHVPRFFVYIYSVWSTGIHERSFGHISILWERTVALCKSYSISVNPLGSGRLRERSLGYPGWLELSMQLRTECYPFKSISPIFYLQLSVDWNVQGSHDHFFIGIRRLDTVLSCIGIRTVLVLHIQHASNILLPQASIVHRISGFVVCARLSQWSLIMCRLLVFAPRHHLIARRHVGFGTLCIWRVS